MCPYSAHFTFFLVTLLLKAVAELQLPFFSSLRMDSISLAMYPETFLNRAPHVITWPRDLVPLPALDLVHRLCPSIKSMTSLLLSSSCRELEAFWERGGERWHHAELLWKTHLLGCGLVHACFLAGAQLCVPLSGLAFLSEVFSDSMACLALNNLFSTSLETLWTSISWGRANAKASCTHEMSYRVGSTRSGYPRPPPHGPGAHGLLCELARIVAIN